MAKVIAAAVKSGVAIEINARYKIPRKAFIMQAKKAGVKFACGTNNGGKDLGNLEYCKRMIRECSLTQKNFYDHKKDRKKRMQRQKNAR